MHTTRIRSDVVLIAIFLGTAVLAGFLFQPSPADAIAPSVVVKTVGDTFLAGTPFTDDSEIILSLQKNTTYTISGLLVLTGEDYRFTFSTPASSTYDIVYSQSQELALTEAAPETDDISTNSTNADDRGHMFLHGVIKTGNQSGTLKLRIESIANGNFPSTILHPGTYLRAEAI